jgi:SAM-dependent methyltransferase
MDYKGVNQESYDRYAGSFEQFSKEYLRTHLLGDAAMFMELLPGLEVLDLGCGPGRDSAFFREHGLVPLCFDISPEMLKLCEKKGLATMQGDLENLPFKENSFDGVWAYTSLLHMPKANLPPVLGKISEILRPRGVFYLGMKEGDFEGFKESDRYPGTKRFFAYYTDAQLRTQLSPLFRIVHDSKIVLGDATFLNYLCEKLQTK